ncbi:helix-turn-helix transcriptional regulator [Brachybacterium halotolerans subsp. kimchii]|uniref:helix-turn-helix transcriptional regulator n=1 Tax=Brachybacterium halotolerans TaxID=2795215 RepID=UPI001E44E023|nr:PAS domain-containing protein [Brachybacterium halotolerans]UEJ81872.1 helix-turn-helix transcriptional regulator [Brachybacterium halotolerans subsp. kimchii]
MTTTSAAQTDAAESGPATGSASPEPPQTDMRFADIDEAHRALAPVMEAIAAVGGPHCEVVLHDLSAGDLEHSIHAILHGEVSGRRVGGPSTNLGAEVLHDQSRDHNAFGYRARTADGRELISSSVYYRDHEGRIIAALCINRDLTPVQGAMDALAALLPASADDASSEPHELVVPNVSDVLDDMIAEAIAAVGKPAPTMTKADRIEVLRLLEGRGAFHIKRAAERVSARLGVSRVTTYGYLDEVRRG